MHLMFLTLNPFSAEPGHLARLSAELCDLSKLNVVSVLCLGEKPDDEKTKRQYNNIHFSHLPIKFDGWAIVNLRTVIKDIANRIEIIKPDIVILQMEIWDLMRGLGNLLYGKVKFVTVIHAMPFLGTPIYPSGDFEKDVIDYASSGIEKYRRDYILAHYKEINNVFERVSIIANNKTVAYYLSIYCKNIKFYMFDIPVIIKKHKRNLNDINSVYDFAYMARMEKGKGVEYLAEILKRISLILKRTITIALLGRSDDSMSSKAIDGLLMESKKNKYFKVIYFGWASKTIKELVLSNTSVFLYPSHYDTHAVVLCEALSFGLPCVVWDVPFTNINYNSTKAVVRVKYLDFQQFAESAVKVFENKEVLMRDAINFIDSFESPAKLVESDSIIYKDIINYHND